MSEVIKGNNEEIGYNKVPLIGDAAPGFVADSTMGKINFPEDYKGKWVILFSHPADFTPVCTSELATFAALAEDFKKLNTELVGISVDSVNSHLAWLNAIQSKIEFNAYKGQPINYPIIADVKMEVAKKYGMIQPNASDTKAVRAVFFIDPEAKVRALIYYPLTNGRNFEELLRILIAMQTTDKYGVSTPADWKPGNDVVLSAPANMAALKERREHVPEGARCSDWFFCVKPLNN